MRTIGARTRRGERSCTRSTTQSTLQRSASTANHRPCCAHKTLSKAAQRRLLTCSSFFLAVQADEENVNEMKDGSNLMKQILLDFEKGLKLNKVAKGDADGQ